MRLEHPTRDHAEARSDRWFVGFQLRVFYSSGLPIEFVKVQVGHRVIYREKLGAMAKKRAPTCKPSPGRTILTKETSAANRREVERDSAPEEAAARCDEISRDWTGTGNELKAYAADYLAKCIRDLKFERSPA